MSENVDILENANSYRINLTDEAKSSHTLLLARQPFEVCHQILSFPREVVRKLFNLFSHFKGESTSESSSDQQLFSLTTQNLFCGCVSKQKSVIKSC